ncbi:hypothetical protein Enr17x_04490 [Gimesia fumaroli]|uniref:Uncharacterized protein n=1 Tax=Gimesia fumaroli TaxID=2527976 RepID=A0A518I5S0_9PLAN|nr:hypothetical protein Enr17x_04490 [Gimesia fumaroli]
MPNSNPFCETKSQCSDSEAASLVAQYPQLCVSGDFADDQGPVAGPVTFEGSGSAWFAPLGGVTYHLLCKDSVWHMNWGGWPGVSGDEDATGGSIPYVSFSSFSTAPGACQS